MINYVRVTTVEVSATRGTTALVMVRDKAGLRQGHNDQSRRDTNVADNAIRRIPVAHKYPLGIEPGSLMTGSKQVDHWTSGTVYESSEIAGFP
jgi:hypothetical protein